MSCSSKGRSYRKLYDTIPVPPATLGIVVNESNTATIGAKFGGDLEATGFIKGDGSLLTNLPSAPSVTLTTVCNNDNVATIGAVFQGDLEATGFVKGNGSQLTNLPIPNLQDVTSVNSSTSVKVSFQNLVTSLETSGNVLVTGNVTASKFYGSGSELTSIASPTDLNDNSSRISTLEGKPIITNTSGITTNFTKGDILYASGNNTLTRLPKGNAGQFLTIHSSSGIPTWTNGPSASTSFITESYNTSGEARVGIHNTSPQHSISFGKSYYEYVEGVSATGEGRSNLVIDGNIYAEYFYGSGTGLTNIQQSGSSDIRIKSNISIIVNSLDTISKLNPVIYEKNGMIESGFIAQDIWYDAPELKHAVVPGDGATPNETKNEPSYDDWGANVAQLDYHCIIPYAVGAINELREMVEQLEK